MTKRGDGENGTDVRETVKYRESYDSIVTYFKTLKTPSVDQMILLMDTVERTSSEIYEYYRMLQDMFHMRLKEMPAGGISDPREQLAHIIQRRYGVDTLLREKHESCSD